MNKQAGLPLFVAEAVGATTVYLVLAIAFVVHVQGLVDSGLYEVPWMYLIPRFLVSYPFLAPANAFSEHLRPLFQPFEGIFGSSDNAAIFIIFALQALFWGLILVSVRRLIIIAYHKLERKGNEAYQDDADNSWQSGRSKIGLAELGVMPIERNLV